MHENWNTVDPNHFTVLNLKYLHSHISSTLKSTYRVHPLKRTDAYDRRVFCTQILIYWPKSHMPDLSNIFIITLSLSDNSALNDTCVCAGRPPYGPYCEKWHIVPFEFCYLKNSSHAHLCPGARLSPRGIYFTTAKSVCNRSRSKCFHSLSWKSLHLHFYSARTYWNRTIFSKMTFQFNSINQLWYRSVRNTYFFMVKK